MNTRISLIVAATALALWSAAAPAKLKNVENAYESDASHVLLPSSSAGQVIIRDCTGCQPVVLRVDSQTRYFVGSPSSTPVSLDELRTAAGADGAASRLLMVFYSLETNVVTRIVLSTG